MEPTAPSHGVDSRKHTPNANQHASNANQQPYSVPDRWTNLDELAAPSPVENVADAPIHHTSLEAARSQDQNRTRSANIGLAALDEDVPKDASQLRRVSARATQLYTISHLVFFSLLGTLARLGLTALTRYPNAPVIFSTVWANFGGSLVMGFLAEDRALFRQEWGTLPVQVGTDANRVGTSQDAAAAEAAKKAHLATKKTIPLYIGLATGFCGSFTSFSSFVRDIFLAMSNDLVAPGPGQSVAVGRNGGYSFMAMLAVIIATLALSLGGLVIGAHVAIAWAPMMPVIPYKFSRRLADPLVVLVAWGCWLGAVLLSIFPPHDFWRGRATFALVFAPPGCLLRFYLSLLLNAKAKAFPLGTFTANILGTALLAMAWDLAHGQVGGVGGCQVLQGIQDGFCGCLTTVSTWVAELNGLQRRSAHVYGVASVAVAFALTVIIMGGMRWTRGFDSLLCH
ncbi:hypothetical protein CDD81_5802 [Ophiocordyceps australis]|uniref:Uncharacterized protein n=1 Tax=Ophiocordyceps australis TaxID=1399860 RepID=A0A2C5Y9G7_9HYPO|nr:hypothetical protein CDD81_5802 [Ophiocordyceps australis]